MSKRARHTLCDVRVMNAMVVTGCGGMCGGRRVCVEMSADGCAHEYATRGKVWVGV